MQCIEKAILRICVCLSKLFEKSDPKLLDLLLIVIYKIVHKPSNAARSLKEASAI